MSKYEYFLNTICYDYTTNKYCALEPKYDTNTGGKMAQVAPSP